MKPVYVGQVTLVFPLFDGNTLIKDKVSVCGADRTRTGQRSVVFGLGNGQLELRYMPANADIEVGDLQVTSGWTTSTCPLSGRPGRPYRARQRLFFRPHFLRADCRVENFGRGDDSSPPARPDRNVRRKAPAGPR
jgi:hypothetical protein